MKKLHFILFLMFSAGIVSAQVKNLAKSDKKAIESLLSVQEKAWNQGDIDGFMEGYWQSENLVFVGGSGATYGWENTRKGYHERYPDRTAMGELSFTILQMDALGENHARVLGKYHLERTIGNASGTFTLLFYRFPEGWKIISDHTSASP